MAASASAAALHALRRRPAAAGRLLPSSSLGPCAKAGGAASTLHATRGAHAPSIQAPSVVRRFCSAGGGYAAGNLPAVRSARVSPLQVPSLVRHYGSTKGAAATAVPASGVPALPRASPLPLFVPRRAYYSSRRRRPYSSEEYSSDEYYSEEYYSDEYSSGEGYKYVRGYCKHDVLDHLFGRIEKVEAGLKQLRRCQWFALLLMGIVTHLYYEEVSILNKKVAALKGESLLLTSMLSADCSLDDEEDDLA